MRGSYSDSDFYVAPSTPPPSRRPPITTVGPLGWAKQNLFSSVTNTLATLLTAVVVGALLWAFFSWAIRSAQWSVVFNNLRVIMAGFYNRDEIWRIQITAAILLFLSGLSIGIWGAITRGAFLGVVVTVAVILLVPLIGATIPEPSAYVLIEPERTPSNVTFLGQEGDEITFGVEPLTSPSDAGIPLGFIEQKSRTEWSTQSRAITSGELDPSNYNLVLSVRLLDAAEAPVSADGEPAQVSSTPDNPGGSQTVTLAKTGWYELEVTRDDEANDTNAGYAWLRIKGVELFSSAQDDQTARIDEYGPPPGGDRVLFAEEDAFRFEGTRTFAEFISLQVAPFFNKLALPAVIAALLFFNGWTIGHLGKREQPVRRLALIAWAISPVAIYLVLAGIPGSHFLPSVPPANWGGLLLTLLLTIVGIVASFPLGVALALGRRSDLPAIKWTCTLFIEMVRGVPLITILFMAKLIVPFFWSGLANIDLTVRMMIGVTLFSAAYVAENVRGGLQIIPKGQLEAARALGMNPMLTTTLIVLPQALRAVIPALVGQFISLFKDTSLVAVVGLFELVGIVDTIVSGQPIYRPYQREAYIFIAIIYFVISYAMSGVSYRLEASGAGSVRKMR
ncbi:MAG TPA: amino acid ABC transporter permease [Aggregatilinea sp.]|uniref:amino acid ABC transporter permease n=1 Tax=Aggregatilinea sp. TaxID=2806333 RepID=UPI002C855396|nr:amino acid ABC transporter permease [Aggregatilinea sp.]HML21089.1 amino acid ABC transporter permease [Aggregatilinea sp.]